MLNKPGNQKKIFFWERIAFRIVLGFVLPVAVCAYALHSVSSNYSDLSESKERTQRIWNSIHLIESRAILTLTKIRMTAQSVLVEPQANFYPQMKNELQAFRIDLDQSKRLTGNLARENAVPASGQLNKFYNQIGEIFRQFSASAEKFSDAIRRQSPYEATTAKREMDRMAKDMEGLLAKLRAANELFELRINQSVLEKEGDSRSTFSFYLIAVFFFGLGAAAVVTMSITSPVRQVLNRMKDIANGDGDLTKRVYTRAGGEMRELASWVNVFLEKTHSIIGTISNASRVVSETTEQVGFHTNRTSVAAAGISKNMM